MQKRTKTLKIRLTESERAELKNRAGKMTMASFARECAIHQPPVQLPSINEAAVRELIKIGANLNQLARLANTSARKSTRGRLDQLLDQVHIESIMIASSVQSLRDPNP